jgi:hypothetical protein
LTDPSACANRKPGRITAIKRERKAECDRAGGFADDTEAADAHLGFRVWL